MNERIKTLIETAVKDYHASAKSATHTIPVSRVKEISEDARAAEIALIPDDFCEKFAELIVKECANQCDLLLNHKMSSEWARGTHDCSKAIKEHFGVE